jgi:hypothetical protein
MSSSQTSREPFAGVMDGRSIGDIKAISTKGSGRRLAANTQSGAGSVVGFRRTFTAFALPREPMVLPSFTIIPTVHRHAHHKPFKLYVFMIRMGQMHSMKTSIVHSSVAKCREHREAEKMHHDASQPTSRCPRDDITMPFFQPHDACDVIAIFVTRLQSCYTCSVRTTFALLRNLLINDG